MDDCLVTYAKVSKDESPVICVQINNQVAELSVAEARQFALGVLSTAERASYMAKLEDFLYVNLGQEKAMIVQMTIESMLRNESEN